jgi:hypothetical protein
MNANSQQDKCENGKTHFPSAQIEVIQLGWGIKIL